MKLLLFQSFFVLIFVKLLNLLLDFNSFVTSIYGEYPVYQPPPRPGPQERQREREKERERRENSGFFKFKILIRMNICLNPITQISSLSTVKDLCERPNFTVAPLS